MQQQYRLAITEIAWAASELAKVAEQMVGQLAENDDESPSFRSAEDAMLSHGPNGRHLASFCLKMAQEVWLQTQPEVSLGQAERMFLAQTMQELRQMIAKVDNRPVEAPK